MEKAFLMNNIFFICSYLSINTHFQKLKQNKTKNTPSCKWEGA